MNKIISIREHKYFTLVLGVIVITALVAFVYTFVGKGKAQDFGDLAGANDTLVAYAGNDSSYTFKKPESWNVHEIPGMSYLRIENLDARVLDSLPKSIRDQYFKIEVVKLPALGLSLNDWVHRQNTTSYPLPTVHEHKEVEVAGQPAIYQLEQFGHHVSPAIFVKKNDRIYIINPSNNKAEFKGAIDNFLTNFTIGK